MPKTTPEQFTEAIISTATSFQRADASDSEELVAKFYTRYASHISIALGDSHLDETIESFSAQPPSAATIPFLNALKSLLENKAANASTSNPGMLNQWKTNLETIIKNIPTPTPRASGLFTRTRAATSQPNTAIAGNHRNKTPG